MRKKKRGVYGGGTERGVGKTDLDASLKSLDVVLGAGILLATLTRGLVQPGFELVEGVPHLLLLSLMKLLAFAVLGLGGGLLRLERVQRGLQILPRLHLRLELVRQRGYLAFALIDREPESLAGARELGAGLAQRGLARRQLVGYALQRGLALASHGSPNDFDRALLDKLSGGWVASERIAHLVIRDFGHG